MSPLDLLAFNAVLAAAILSPGPALRTAHAAGIAAGLGPGALGLKLLSER